MKNSMIIKSLVGSGLAIAVAAMTLSPILTSADQVKGAQLLQPKTAIVSDTAPVAKPAMACPLCKTEFASRADTSARGVNKPSVTVQKHLCPTCDTSIKTVGVGKQAANLAEHTCSMGGSQPSGCCR